MYDVALRRVVILLIAATILSVAGAGLTAAAAETTNVSCTSPTSYANLSNGAHTLQVRATDATGNTDATPDFRTWTVDTTAPHTTIHSGPSGPTNDVTPTFTFSSEPGATFECSLDGAAFTACTSPKTYTNLPDGHHTWDVRATDRAGNVEPPP